MDIRLYYGLFTKILEPFNFWTFNCIYDRKSIVGIRSFKMGVKREFARLKLNVRVNWKKINDTSDFIGEFPDATRDISAGGFCLNMDERLQIGDQLQTRMELPSKKIIKAKAKVVWIREFEITGRGDKKTYDTGIEFTEIRDEDREEINKFVLTLLPS
jgi:c-di-GMP-binding flagellar brake protein YcgR